MKVVQQFEAADGTRFEHANECAEYESLCLQLQAVEALLGPKPQLRDGEFHQHHPEVLKEAASRFADVLRQQYPKECEGKALWTLMSGTTYLARLLAESRYPALTRLHQRFETIDMIRGAEYQQLADLFELGYHTRLSG